MHFTQILKKQKIKKKQIKILYFFILIKSINIYIELKILSKLKLKSIKFSQFLSRFQIKYKFDLKNVSLKFYLKFKDNFKKA